MLAGQAVTLRQVREADLDTLYDAHTDIRSRGAYFPLGVLSQTAFRGAFSEHGFWQKAEGMLVIVPDNGASRRIADKCGFVLEGTARGAFFNDGRNQDVVVYSLLRTDPRPWHDDLGHPAEGETPRR